MIGDSLVTDIPAARAVGARSVLMLTGITDPSQLAALPPRPPDRGRRRRRRAGCRPGPPGRRLSAALGLPP